MDAVAEWEEARSERRPEPMQVPERGGRIRVESRPRSEEETVFDNQADPRPEPRTIGEAADAAGERVAELLDERSTDRSATAERVAYLFPRPETTEWNVREIDYDRRRRAQVRAS